MSVNPADYNSDAINGEQLAALMQDEMYDRLKGDVPESLAVFLCSLKAQVDSLQKIVSEKNLGECVADSINTQSLKVGGTEVKTKQAAKSNPSASSGSATTFVDTISQNENGEMTATRRAMKLYSGTGSNTDAPMTQKAVSDAIDTKAPIASPTFTGTPSAPTAGASTDTTQLATTAFVHDAIENDIKKASDVSGMGNDDTHAYSGEAVSMAISAAVSGNVGGFLGDMTIAQMNAYTTPKMGDNAIVTDTGTITVGSESCVISSAPSEVRWTTSGSWKVSSSGYVRDTQIATTGTAGLVKTNSADGGVSLNSNNQMVVNGLGDLAFLDKADTAQIEDDAITAAKVKDNETLPVNVSLNAGTATHLSAVGCYTTWNTYTSETPYALIGSISWTIGLNNHNGAGQLLQFEFSTDKTALIRLDYITNESLARSNAIVLWSTFSKTELTDAIKITHVIDGSTLTLNIYVKFSGRWQAWRLRQLDAQTGDLGYSDWVPITLYNGNGSNVASPVGSSATISFLSDLKQDALPILSLSPLIYDIIVDHSNDSTYSQRVGTIASHPAIGAKNIPVFVDSDGIHRSAWEIPSTVAGSKTVTNYSGTVVPMSIEHNVNNADGTAANDPFRYFVRVQDGKLQIYVLMADSIMYWKNGKLKGSVTWDSSIYSTSEVYVSEVDVTIGNNTTLISERNVSATYSSKIHAKVMLKLSNSDNNVTTNFILNADISAITPNGDNKTADVVVFSQMYHM